MIDISKEGFEFKVEKSESENGDVVFKVGTTEISKINILVKNADGSPVPNVTVYITSSERGKNVKIVEQTDKNGRISQSIYQGHYYLKAVLKEHTFNPPQLNFQVKEGETYDLDMSTQRTQFSVFGVGEDLKSFANF